MRRTVRSLADEGGSMLLSGRGPEQQSKGVDSVLAQINLMLALGKVGKPSSGYGCLTGQGNGQGGREHGQKADQLPGYRLITDPDHREAIARVWGVDPASLPGKGKSAFELLDSCGPEGGIRALLVFGSNVLVGSPQVKRIEAKVKALDLLVVCDSFLNETARLAHVVLPILQWAEEEGTMTNLEGRVILRRKAVDPPPGVRTDLDVLRELAERLGVGSSFAFRSASEVFDELRVATALHSPPSPPPYEPVFQIPPPPEPKCMPAPPPPPRGAESNLAEMAKRLEAALRRPIKPVESVPSSPPPGDSAGHSMRVHPSEPNVNEP
jgi:assimilatory nitrate reductase catalytic subunit